MTLPHESNHCPCDGDGDGDCATFVSFKKFMQQVKHARFEDYKGGKLQCEMDFEDMKTHIQRMYDGVTDVTSFIRDNEYVDCISVYEQPTVRELGIHTIARPPINSTFGEKSRVWVPGTNFRYAGSALRLGLHDSFGNPISCPHQTIPMSRLTLEKLTRFKSLSHFFAKVPQDMGRPRLREDGPEFAPDWDGPHLHAAARQYVDNFGGNSWLDLWNPQGDFSLSQQWYVGGSGENLQTVEGGWIVLPEYFSADAVLFIYYTRGNYNRGTGCYNLDCSGFVQINNNWHLGGIWNHYSTTDGTQWGFDLQWKLYSGNWWLFIDYEAVGYYPTSIYNGGQLSKQATVIQYGGEVTKRYTTDPWPQMGSGALAANGYEVAAFQNTIFYIPRDENGGVGVWADLTGIDEGFPSCYTFNVVNWPYGGSWGTYLFFGGPGGSGPCN